MVANNEGTASDKDVSERRARIWRHGRRSWQICRLVNDLVLEKSELFHASSCVTRRLSLYWVRCIRHRLRLGIVVLYAACGIKDITPSPATAQFSRGLGCSSRSLTSYA